MLGFTVSALASWLRDRSAHWPADGHRDFAALERECDAFRECLVAAADEFEDPPIDRLAELVVAAARADEPVPSLPELAANSAVVLTAGPDAHLDHG